MKKKEKKLDKKETKLDKKVKNSDKEKFSTKFLNIIKKRWLISGTNTILLIAILIAVVILINTGVASLDLVPIDCTQEKEYTITDESKRRVSSIENPTNVYVIGFKEESETYTIAKQYNKANDKINVELIDVTKRTDIAEKYSVSAGEQVIIIENDKDYKVIDYYSLFTYEGNSEVDLTEEKLTSTILTINSDDVPRVYFLTSYSNYSLELSNEINGMYGLSLYLDNEVFEYETLDMLVTGKIPEDCDTLVITTPIKDFDELTTNEIIKYINNGGNILWFNSSYAEKKDLPNVNKILALYGVNPFDEGYIYETDESKMVFGCTNCIIQNLGNTDIDKNLKRAVLLNPTKINVDDEKLEELNVSKEIIMSTDSTSYFRKDVSNTSLDTEGDTKGGFDIGGIFTKTIKEGKSEDTEETSEENNESSEESNDEKSIVSKLVIYGDNDFITDNQLQRGDYTSNPLILLENNVDLPLNSISYLIEHDEGITIRKKHTDIVTFTLTDGQKSLIFNIIFMAPVAIMILGIVVWQIRRRKK